MVSRNGVLFRSSLLSLPGICHGFSTRLGGVSTHPYTKEMNLAMGREDDDDTVRQNGEIFASLVSGGVLHKEDLVAAPQIHSAKVRILTADNRGEGMVKPAGSECDGFVTDVPGVLPMSSNGLCSVLFGIRIFFSVFDILLCFSLSLCSVSSSCTPSF